MTARPSWLSKVLLLTDARQVKVLSSSPTNSWGFTVKEMNVALVQQDAISQASAVLALEREGLLGHWFITVNGDEPACCVCQAIAWAKGVVGTKEAKDA